MRLSVCMIARNEASRIGLALESVRGIADEIIVVDTGSTDDTVNIAQEHGAKILHHTWNDDFAAARNVAIPHIRGKWVLWLDADERLVHESCDDLDHLLAATDVLAYGVRRHDFADGLKLGQPRGKYVASIILRLLRADLGMTFTGRCHEQPSPDLREMVQKTGMKILASAITLDHDCEYFNEGRIKKSDRNTRLLEMEVRDRPGRLYFMIHCAAAQVERPDTRAKGDVLMRDVLQILFDMRESVHPPFGLAMIPLEYAAFHAAPNADLPFTPDEAIALADRWFPRGAPVLWMRARRAHDKGDFETAIPILRRLLSMGHRHAYDLELPFDPAIIGDDARLNLAACLVREVELDDAEKLLREIPDNSPRFEQARANLAVIDGLRKQFAQDDAI